MTISTAPQIELTNRVKAWLLDNGAHLVGVAPVDRFEGAPRGHHPRDFMSDCKSVLVIASRILDRGIEHGSMMPRGSEFIPDEHLREVLQDYFWEIECHGATSDLLSMLALRAAMMIQDAGFGSLYFRSSDSDIYAQQHLKGKIRPNHAVFSHRHAAVRAGLGEFGLDNVVVTPQYGQRVRFASVLSAAELEPSPLLTEKVCLGVTCGLCLTNCEREGVLSLLPESENDQVWLNPVGVTNKQLCLEVRKQIWCRGQCQGNCPIGERA